MMKVYPINLNIANLGDKKNWDKKILSMVYRRGEIE